SVPKRICMAIGRRWAFRRPFATGTTTQRALLATCLGLILMIPVADRASAQGGQVTYIYDALGRLVGVVDPTGAAAIYRYDAVGNLLSIERQDAGTVSIMTFTPTHGAVGATVTI